MGQALKRLVVLSGLLGGVIVFLHFLVQGNYSNKTHIEERINMYHHQTLEIPTINIGKKNAKDALTHPP